MGTDSSLELPYFRNDHMEGNVMSPEEYMRKRLSLLGFCPAGIEEYMEQHKAALLHQAGIQEYTLPGEEPTFLNID